MYVGVPKMLSSIFVLYQRKPQVIHVGFLVGQHDISELDVLERDFFFTQGRHCFLNVLQNPEGSSS